MRTVGTRGAAALLIFTTVAWGAMFAVAKSALGSIDAFWLSTWRYGPASLAMLAMLWAFEGRAALLPGRDAIRLWFFGSLGFAGFSILGYLGLAQSKPEHAAIIVCLMPLLSSLLSWLAHRRRPSASTIVATLVALTGVVLVITKGHVRIQAEGTLRADAMVFAGVVCWVAYTMGAATLPRFSTLRYTTLSMALGTVTIFAVTLAATASGAVEAPAWDAIGAFPIEIAYLSLIGGVLAVLAWNAGIAALGPNRGVLFINLVPITAFAIGAAQGHRFGRAEIVGVVLVVGALVANSLSARSASGGFARSPKFA